MLERKPDSGQENEIVVVALSSSSSSLQLNPTLVEYLNLSQSQVEAIQQVTMQEHQNALGPCKRVVMVSLSNPPDATMLTPLGARREARMEEQLRYMRGSLNFSFEGVRLQREHLRTAPISPPGRFDRGL